MNEAQRFQIRDRRLNDKTQPRIMDLIRTEDGEFLIEVKDGKQRKTILLEDMQNQIKNYISV